MKKIGALVLSFILLAFSALSISGCSNDGFELVKSVSITTNGEEKTFKSTTTPQVSFTNDKYIAYDEFYAAPENRKLYGTGVNVNELSKITISDAIKAAKNATYYEIVEKELDGYWYHKYSHTIHGNVYYVKYEYEKTYCTFVYVKVKNDSTIVIKRGSAETTYTVSSYSIVKF